MKNINTYWKALTLSRVNAALLFFLCLLASCEKADFGDSDEEGDESGNESQATLTIKTRAANDDGEEISYPVNVYVMNSNGECVEVSRLDSQVDKLQFSLNAGKYDVYAIAGAYEEGYEIPTKENANKSSEIKLIANMEHGDLMAASNSVSLTKGEKNTLTLAMNRKVAKIETINLEGLPSDVTDVEVTLSPLAKCILLDGSNSNETTTKTIPLSKTTDGIWTNNSGYYITESTSNITIKVGVTVDGSKSSYSSSYKGKVEVNHKLTINGKYDDNTISLEGVVYGAKWGDPVTIDFEIGKDSTDDSGSSSDEEPKDDDDNDSQVYGEAPEVGSLYDNCIVIKSSSNTSTKSTTVTLMTIEEYNKLSYSKSQKGKDNSKFQAEIASCVDETLAYYGDDNLRLPSQEEIEYVANNIENINDYITNLNGKSGLYETTIATKASGYYCGYYFTADDGNIYVYTLDGNIDQEPNPNRATYKVRGFKTIEFKAE